MSKRIFELEKELGQTLFHRSGGVALTGEGRAFRPYAEQMLNLREQAAERLKRSSQYASHLFIGCTYAYYDLRLGAQIDGFAGENPGCSVKVRLAHSGHLIGLLLKSAFLAAMLVTNAIISQVNSAKIGGAVPTLTETRIKDFDVAIPVSEAEKEQIGQFFSQLDHLITLHQRERKNTDFGRKES